MAKSTDSGTSRNNAGVDPSLAIIAGNLAAGISRDGVMAGAHDNMIALQAIRIYYAIIRVQAMVDADSELADEPITEKALGCLNEMIKKNRVAYLAELQRATEFAAAETAKPTTTPPTVVG